MQKTLTTAGNSVALVIDKPIQQMLGLYRDQRVWVRIDGRKLVIEAVTDETGDPSYIPPSDNSACAPVVRAPRTNKPPNPLDALDEAEITAFRTSRELLEYFAMTSQQFGRLAPGAGSPFAFFFQLERGWMKSSPQAELKVARMAMCLELREAGSTWGDALDETDRRLPLATPSVPT